MSAKYHSKSNGFALTSLMISLWDDAIQLPLTGKVNSVKGDLDTNCSF